MRKEYKVYASERKEVYVEKESIIEILKQENINLLGGSDRYIENGKIFERDYRFNSPDLIKEATTYEIKLNKSLNKVIEHLSNN